MRAGTASPPIRVAFILTELTLGGAEMMLWKLLSRIDRERFEPFVIALSPRTDSILELFRRIDVPCEVLGMRTSLRGAASVFRLRRLLRQLKPDIVQGWLYHGNVAATLGSLFWDNRPPVIWNVRAALAAGDKRLTTFLIWSSAKLSFLPYKIINNSMASALEHESLGFRSDKRVVLPNGFDTELFRPSAETRSTVRRTLGISLNAITIGLLARYHPVKDHANFFAAAALVSARFPDVQFLLAGEDIDAANGELRELILRHALEGRVHLLGMRSDIPALMASLDVLVCSSYGEGFPNVVGEAMSCAVPCVVTDVGDSAAIVADTGRAVPPRDPAALARGIIELIEIGAASRAELGERARARVLKAYSLDAVVRRYEDLYLHMYAQSTAQRA